MARAAMNQSAIAKERREMREEQKKQLMDAVPSTPLRAEVRPVVILGATLLYVMSYDSLLMSTSRLFLWRLLVSDLFSQQCVKVC